MQRTDINPWEWSKSFGFSQAVELRGSERLLICSGQTAVDANGAPPTTSDIGEQFRLALTNLVTVLKAAGFEMSDVVKLTTYTTDVDGLLAAYEPVRADFFGSNLPGSTLLGVTRLAFPELKIEVEATAAR